MVTEHALTSSKASFSVLKIKEMLRLLGHCKAIWLRTDILRWIHIVIGLIGCELKKSYGIFCNHGLVSNPVRSICTLFLSII